VFCFLAQITLCVYPISAKCAGHAMLEKTTEQSGAPEETLQGYRVSNGPVVRLARSDSKPPAEFADAIELPRVYGAPLLFAIARDPRTLFVYWNIDWAAIFESTAPVDRQVHLRVYRADGTEEMTEAVEPLAGNCYLSVSEPRETYRVEIGYYQPENAWNPVAISERTIMPPEQVVENLDVDVATIPFHLSFQRLIDLFRASSNDALSEIISRLQRRAVSEKDQALLSPEEWELLRAMDLSIEDMSGARRGFAGRGRNGAALRRRAEALLGFGGTSPRSGFGGSSWS
jgi:hypothetical protein